MWLTRHSRWIPLKKLLHSTTMQSPETKLTMSIQHDNHTQLLQQRNKINLGSLNWKTHNWAEQNMGARSPWQLNFRHRGSLVWKLLCVTFLVRRIFKWLLHSWKTCMPAWNMYLRQSVRFISMKHSGIHVLLDTLTLHLLNMTLSVLWLLRAHMHWQLKCCSDETAAGGGTVNMHLLQLNSGLYWHLLSFSTEWTSHRQHVCVLFCLE